MKKLNENSLAEQPTLEWLRGMGYEIVFGPDIAPGGPFQEREDFRSVILKSRLLRALKRLNPGVPDEALEEGARELHRVASGNPDLILANKEVYKLFQTGLTVQVREGGEHAVYPLVLFDFANPLNNEFVAVNQFAVAGAEQVRRPDVVVFVNGVPLAVFELKSPVSNRPEATIESAIDQLAEYKKDIPALFAYNQVLVVSDLLKAKHGTISSSREWFAEWKYVTEEGEERPDTDLRTLVEGIFEKRRFMDVVENFIVFEADSEKDATTYTKKMCKYHQFYGVNRAIERAKKAVKLKPGNRKIGVFWHTQGSGKTLSMVFFANKLKSEPELKSPALLFLTDRNDLDGQLHKTFLRSGYAAIAKQMDTIDELKTKLRSPGAEIIFSTIQKFDTKQEVLSESDNIIVIADEAHRSNYAKFAGNVRDALPNASFMGITGTPISFDNRDTRLVFGQVISEYRIDQAEKDKATVPIYYQSRFVPLDLQNNAVDEEFAALLSHELTPEDEQRVKRKFARLVEAIGAPERLDKIAADIVEHFNQRGLVGKGMVVAVNQRVAVELYKRIIAQPNAPQAAVVISDYSRFEGETQEETNVRELEKQFKNPDHPLQLAIVCEMWLTGFDVPCLHTMYIDKPLRGHTLMQTVARVNRIYKDKPAGLIVDYIGIATELKKALSLYSSDIKDRGVFPLEEAIEKMREKYEHVCAYLAGVEYANWRKESDVATAEILRAAVSAVLGRDEHIDDARVQEFLDESERLFKLHAIVMPHKEANAIRDDIEFFRNVRNAVHKYTTPPTPPGTGLPKDAESAVRSLLSSAIAASDVIDIFAAKGKENPEISIFDERFLQEVEDLHFKNLAVEMLHKLLRDEIMARRRKNEVRYTTLLELLEKLIEDYENNVISSAQVIEQLIELARTIKLQDTVGINLGLSEDELAFYDALSGGKQVLKSDDERKRLVQELVKIIRRDLSVDWTNNDQIKASIRANIRLLLLRSGYKVEDAPGLIDSIFLQAQALYRDLVA